ncbi:MAG: hypothetical protein SVE93_02145, partial [Candidatus Thermoplasmatota archaeon]|nr:hypothetical protein [Candidatus Thermoplasmatota archaeon]
MQKVLFVIVFLLLLLPPASAQFNLTADMRADINVEFDSLMHANYSIEGYIFSVKAFGIAADPASTATLLKNKEIREPAIRMIREEFVRIKNSIFPSLNLTLKTIEISPETAVIGNRRALVLRLGGDMSIAPEDIGYSIDLDRIFNAYDPVAVVSSMIAGAEGMKSSELPERKPEVSEEEIYEGALKAGAYADINFSLKRMQSLGIDYRCRIVLPEGIKLENTNLRAGEGGHVIEFDQRASAIKGRVASTSAPRYEGEGVSVQGYASIDESTIAIDIPAFFRSLWLEDAARGHVSARVSMTIDHFRAPGGMREIMPEGTGMDYIDADAIRFGYRIGMLTDEDIREMFEVIVPAIERMYQGLFSGFGGSKVTLSVDVEGFIDQLKEEGPLTIDLEGYLDVPLIALIRGSGASDAGGAFAPGLIRIARNLVDLGRTR